jgi:hypothetical protein
VSVTPETPEGDLDVRNEPIVFTAEKPITSISVEFNPDDGNGPRETVYDGTDVTNANGTFAHVYRDSTRDGNEWTIRRETGWPAPFKLAIKEADGAFSTPGLSSRAALTPTLYSPLGQWALQGFPDPAQGYLDRSGNGQHLDHGEPFYGTDLIPGARAARPVQGKKLQRKAITPALQLTGEMTYMIRYKLDALGGSQQLGSFSSVYAADWPSATMWELGIGSDGAPWYARTINPTSNLDYRSPPTLRAAAGGWQVATLRRAVDHVTFGINLSFEDGNLPISLPPQVASGSYLTIGSDGDSNNEVNGLIADASYWGAYLTDEQLIPLIVVALGL